MIAYNHASFVRETVSSILNQSFADLELILVDNSSTDETPQILEQIQDPRFFPYRRPNLGVSLASNFGIAKSRGKFIAIASADDSWHPEKLKNQLRSFEKTTNGASFTNVRLINEKSEQVDDVKSPFCALDLTREKIYEKFFFESNFLCATSALIKREYFDSHLFEPSLIQLQDYEMWLWLIKRTSFSICPDRLVNYRVRSDGENLSLDTRNKPRVQFELNKVYERFFDEVDDQFFVSTFGSHFRKPASAIGAGLSFEKAFLYLKMQDPAIQILGIKLLYELMDDDDNRAFAEENYGMSMIDLWNIARTPFFLDSAAVKSGNGLSPLASLDQSESLRLELSEAQRTIKQLTSGKMWKLRNGIHKLIRGLGRE